MGKKKPFFVAVVDGMRQNGGQLPFFPLLLRRVFSFPIFWGKNHHHLRQERKGKRQVQHVRHGICFPIFCSCHECLEAGILFFFCVLCSFLVAQIDILNIERNTGVDMKLRYIPFLGQRPTRLWEIHIITQVSTDSGSHGSVV